jgi:tetratricopeptide (TPR) repeat protein
MSKSLKHPPKPLRERIQKARAEGRMQQGLELAKELAKQEPSDETRSLVRDITFERGCQLLGEGKTRDARIVFQNALAFESTPEFRAAIAEKLARLGDASAALAVLAQLPEGEMRAKAFAHAVDAAIVKGAAGKVDLPADLHDAFTAVIAAFDAVEKGDDAAARDALQAISLTSPFLEWKVMLRGLIAYHQNEDVRALENWQRLSAERQPWRLVAPLRFAIDPSFRDAQPMPTRSRMQALLDATTGTGLGVALRSLAKLLVPWDNAQTPKQAIKLASEIHAALNAKKPALAAKLAQILYVKIATEGDTTNIERMRATLPMPADDPHGYRLQALQASDPEDTPLAVDSWLAYRTEIATLTNRFPGESNALAQALVWEHIAGIMSDMAEEFTDIPASIPRAAECYRKSIALVANRVLPHVRLLDELKSDKSKSALAVTAAKKLVAKFPDHAPTWQFLGDSYRSLKKSAEAIDAYRAALKADPMQSDLRRKLADSLWEQAVKAATPAARAKSLPAPETYRPLIEESLRSLEGNPVPRLAAWAILEEGLKQEEFAAKLLADARQRPHQRVALPLALHLAAQFDKKIAPPRRDELARMWDEAIAVKPTAAEALAGLEAIAEFNSRKIKGKKAYVTNLLPSLSNEVLEKFSETYLLNLGRLCVTLGSVNEGKKFAAHGQARFPKNPDFWFLEFDATKKDKTWRLDHLLRQARNLIPELPRELQEVMLKGLKSREKLFSPPSDVFDLMDEFRKRFGRGFGGGFFGGGFGEDDDGGGFF